MIEEIGGYIDVLILDTRHIHPLESLNFLCAFPFMKRNNSLTVLHDICVFHVPRYRTHPAGRILWSSVVSERKIYHSEVSRLILPELLSYISESRVAESGEGNVRDIIFPPQLGACISFVLICNGAVSVCNGRAITDNRRDSLTDNCA